jgi:GxxExxY protein
LSLNLLNVDPRCAISRIAATGNLTEGNEGNEDLPEGDPSRSSFTLLPSVKNLQSVHPLYRKADKLSREIIGAAIEVHRQKGPGLIESIYERCLLRELELRSIPAATQKIVRVEYKGLVFDEPLRFDILVDACLLIELKAVEILHPFSQAQLFSYMKLLDIPVGLLINFHEPVLKNGISRMLLPGANQIDGNEEDEVSF